MGRRGEDTPHAETSLGERLQELRLSLQTNDKRGRPVPRGAMDAVMDSPDTRYKWQRLELDGDLRNPEDLRKVTVAAQKLSRMLQVDDPKKTEAALMAFIKGEKPLPWKQAPAWIDFQPWKPVGRPAGSRALNPQRFLLPGRDHSGGVELPPEPVALPAEAANPAVVAILKAVRAGEMSIEAAVPTLRVLFASTSRNG